MVVQKINAPATYLVTLFDTFALVGRIPIMSADRVRKHLEERPEFDGEHHGGRHATGTRDVLLEQFPWLPEDVLDACDAIPNRQQKVFYDSLEGDEVAG